MCFLGPIDPNVWTFFVPYVEFNLGPLIGFAIIGLMLFALFRVHVPLWSRLLLGAVFVFAVLVVFLIFSGSLCGAPAPMLPIEYGSATVLWPDLEYGEATLFVVRPGTGWGPSGLVLWQGRVRIPDCEGACTLPQAGVLYRCDEYGFEEFSHDEVSAWRGGIDMGALLMRTDAPCELRHVTQRELIEAQLSKRS